MLFNKLTNAVGSDAIFLVISVKLVAAEAGANDTAEEDGAFLLAQIQSARILIGLQTASGHKSVALAATPPVTILPRVGLFVVASVALHDHIFRRAFVWSWPYFVIGFNGRHSMFCTHQSNIITINNLCIILNLPSSSYISIIM